MKKALALLLTLAFLACLCPALALDFTDFSDVSGHWSEVTLEKAFSDGLIEGFEDKTLRPDEPITTAQMLTLIVRLLNAETEAEVSVTPADAWYASAYKKAVHLGILSAGDNVDLPMSRQDSLALLAKAFSLVPAQPDFSVLDNYYDNNLLTEENRPAMAALVSKKLVEGFGGALSADSSITRAEFMTLLYRVAQSYTTAEALDSTTVSTVVSGNAAIFSKNFGSLLFDCSCSNLLMSRVDALSVTLRSHSLDKLQLVGVSELGELVVDCGSYELTDDSLYGVTIDRLRLSGKGTAELTAAKAANIEVTSPDVTAILGGEYGELAVTEGSVVLTGSAETIKLLGSARLTVATGATAQSIIVSGDDAELTVNGEAQDIEVTGENALINGSGHGENATIRAKNCTMTLQVTNLTDKGSQDEIDRVLSLVTLGYQGDYTLAWAEAHDYEACEKELWINAKCYDSPTGYLIWVNLSMQRVNIFQGSKENWSLIRSSIVGTGAPGRGTPVGVYYTTYRQDYGWTTSTYTVRPVVGFKLNTGYAFHSRLYYPGSSKLTDASIGYPVSHGCVRMYDEDVWYIYNSIPLNTTVVVY